MLVVGGILVLHRAERKADEMWLKFFLFCAIRTMSQMFPSVLVLLYNLPVETIQRGFSQGSTSVLQQKEPVVKPAYYINGSGNCPNGDNLIRALRVIPVQ